MSVKEKIIEQIYTNVINENMLHYHFGEECIFEKECIDEVIVALEIIEGDKKYSLFEDIKDKDFNAYIYNHGLVKELKIELLDGSKEVYDIKISYEYRSGKFCDCDKESMLFNKQYQCCGLVCEWEAPLITIMKRINIGQIVWDKNQRNYWLYKESIINKYSDIYKMYDCKLLTEQHSKLLNKMNRLKDELQEMGKDEKNLKNKISALEYELKK